MSYTRYTEEFKRDAVSQVTDRGYRGCAGMALEWA